MPAPTERRADRGRVVDLALSFRRAGDVVALCWAVAPAAGVDCCRRFVAQAPPDRLGEAERAFADIGAEVGTSLPWHRVLRRRRAEGCESHAIAPSWRADRQETRPKVCKNGQKPPS